MANHSTNIHSSDFLKLVDDVEPVDSDATDQSGESSNFENSNFLFGNYDFSGASSIGSNNNGTITPNTTLSAPPSMSNQSLQYQFDYGTHSNDSVRQNYEAGSNFMLLLEDFGEYFYNYNGSTGISGSGGATNGTGIGYEFQTNCSIANSTCGDNPGNILLPSK